MKYIKYMVWVMIVTPLTLLTQNSPLISPPQVSNLSPDNNEINVHNTDLVFSPEANEILKQHLDKLELTPELIKDFTFDLNGRIWIGSRDGLWAFDGTIFRSYTYKDGLFDKGIHHIHCSNNGYIWVATSSGPFALLDNHFYVFEPLKNKHIFSISENAESLIFLTKDGLRTFKKKKHFYETGLLRWVGLAISFVLLSALLFWIIKRFKINVEWKASLIKAEQEALLAQMNPHFIFNSLNSVQRYIMANDKDAAQTYLQKFASMMRKVLENSNQPTITLSEEIAALDLYLQLESLRFDHGFDFEIAIAEKNISHYEIPRMLIQTFVENAIWHGLMKKEGRGKIDIRFSMLNKKLILCEIEDNGIGRKKAAEYKSNSRVRHRSKGTEIVGKRINLMNLKSRDKIVCETIDLGEDNNQQTGTLVRLHIPVVLI